MNFKLHTQLGAKFKLIVRKVSDNSIARETAWFHNIVLDAGLARMSAGTWINRCCIGTGNSTPVATQVALDSFLASTTTVQSTSESYNTTTLPYYYGAKVTWRFGEGVAAGNISEVGLGWSNTNLWNRALIKDGNGNPTTITVLSDEYLDVVSEIRVYPSSSSGSFNLLDKTGAVISTHTYSGMPYISSSGYFSAGIVQIAQSNWGGIYSGTMGSLVTSEPSSVIANFTPALTYPTPTSVQISITLGLTSSNGSHQSFLLRNLTLMGNAYIGYKFQISPTITKTSSQIMTYTFKMSWDRYTG
ncbi:hypothetical protein [Acinetobacter sp. ANC 4639]